MIPISTSSRRSLFIFFTILGALSICFAASGQIVQVNPGDKIAFLGDSITSYGWKNPEGYIQLVMAGLDTNGIKAVAVPAGVSGNTSKDMLARLDRDVLSNHPVWMTLSCGVNDVWHGKNGVEIEPYKQNITSIINQCQAAGIKVMILSATMIKEDPATKFNQQLVAYNEFLAGLAAEKQCLFADLNGAMQASVKHGIPGQKPGNMLTADGVHMNPWGNQMMATEILKAFGLNETQLAKARKAWQNIQMSVTGKRMMPLQQLEQLSVIAESQHITTDDLINKAFSATVEDLLKSAANPSAPR